MKKTVVALVILLQFSIANCQTNSNDFPVLKGAYLGQKLPGLTPEIFAPGIVSTNEFEFGGTFSPDGTEYFFTRRPDYEGAENRIYFMQIVDGKWTKKLLRS